MSPRLRVLLCGSAILLVACGDTRSSKLSVGISKDSALKIMSQAPERNEAYLVNGRDIIALFFGKPGAAAGATPSEELLPIVLVNDSVAGWGWKGWEKIAADYRIQVKR
jgi:hypothetical protein